MKQPWKKSDKPSQEQAGSHKVTAAELDKPDAQETPATGAAETATEGSHKAKKPKGYTPPKGKATPKRRDQEIERGVRRDPNAMTPEQARQHRKELKKSMSKEEWAEYKRKERKETQERNAEYQRRLDSGDERYLLDRDKGKERKYVRDWVDSKRFLNNYLMWFALILLVFMLISTFVPQMATFMTIFGMVAILVFLVEGITIGWRAQKAVQQKFPDTVETGLRLRFYAYNRANQPRRWRTPKPQVNIGDRV